MNCPHCHKLMLPSRETLSRDVGNGVTVSVAVPADVCLECAESIVSHDDLATLDVYAKAFVRAVGAERTSTPRRWAREVRRAAFGLAALVAFLLIPEDDE